MKTVTVIQLIRQRKELARNEILSLERRLLLRIVSIALTEINLIWGVTNSTASPEKMCGIGDDREYKGYEFILNYNRFFFF